MISEEMKQFLEGVVGIVEANSFEKMCLWKENQDQMKYEWKENNLGYLPTIGELAGMPVVLSLFTADVNGHKLLFYHPTSQVVDWRQIEAWLQLNLPKTAFRENGYPNKTDAMNFSNIFRN